MVMKTYNPFQDLHIISSQQTRWWKIEWFNSYITQYNKNYMHYIKFNSNVMGMLQNKTQVNRYENI